MAGTFVHVKKALVHGVQKRHDVQESRIAAGRRNNTRVYTDVNNDRLFLQTIETPGCAECLCNDASSTLRS
jgi:hypothetical protein